MLDPPQRADAPGDGRRMRMMDRHLAQVGVVYTGILPSREAGRGMTSLREDAMRVRVAAAVNTLPPAFPPLEASMASASIQADGTIQRVQSLQPTGAAGQRRTRRLSAQWLREGPLARAAQSFPNRHQWILSRSNAQNESQADAARRASTTNAGATSSTSREDKIRDVIAYAESLGLDVEDLKDKLKV